MPIIQLHYGPNRNAVPISKFGLDHPFSRLMPDEQTALVDDLLTKEFSSIVLVEEYPLTYLRYLLRSKTAELTLMVFWWENGSCREIRIGESGEFLDPWPTGNFDRSLEFVLGHWG